MQICDTWEWTLYTLVRCNTVVMECLILIRVSLKGKLFLANMWFFIHEDFSCIEMYKSHSANNINDNQESLRYSLSIYWKYEYGNYNVKNTVGLQFLLEIWMAILGQRQNSRNFNRWSNQAWCEILIHSGFFIYYLGGHSLIVSYSCLTLFTTLGRQQKPKPKQIKEASLLRSSLPCDWRRTRMYQNVSKARCEEDKGGKWSEFWEDSPGDSDGEAPFSGSRVRSAEWRHHHELS